MMRNLTAIVALLVASVAGAWAQDTDGDGLPDAIEAQLGADAQTASIMTTVAT